LAVVGLFGGLVGSVLLELTPNQEFRAAVPWLILLSCILLLGIRVGGVARDLSLNSLVASWGRRGHSGFVRLRT
jgi:hypothetical protein